MLQGLEKALEGSGHSYKDNVKDVSNELFGILTVLTAALNS